MENNKAKWLLENLLARLAIREDGKKELPGVITEAEQESLHLAVELLESRLQETPRHIAGDVGKPAPKIIDNGDAVKPEDKDEVELTAGQDEEVAEPETHNGITVEIPSYFDEPVSEDYRLCIDFGTAMSKVTLVHDGAGKDGGDEIQVLELGDVAGQDPSDGPLELLISSVYI